MYSNPMTTLSLKNHFFWHNKNLIKVRFNNNLSSQTLFHKALAEGVFSWRDFLEILFIFLAGLEFMPKNT